MYESHWKKISGKNTGKKVPIFLSPKVFGKNVTGKKEFMSMGTHMQKSLRK